MVALVICCATVITGFCCLELNPRAIACANWKSTLKTSLGEYYKLRLKCISLWPFSFCMILDLVSRLVAHPMMGFIDVPKPEKMVEMNSGAFFTLLKVILCGLFQFIYFFLQNYCKDFLFHSLQHSVFHIWIDCINMNSL